MTQLTDNTLQNVLELLSSDADQNKIAEIAESFLSHPFFKRVNVFDKKFIRIVDFSSKHYYYISPEVEALTGFSVSEFREGGLWFVLRTIHPLDMAKLVVLVTRVNNKLNELTAEEKMNARLSYDIRVRCKDGTYKRLLQYCKILLLDNNQKPALLLFTSSDITGYKLEEHMDYTLEVSDQNSHFVPILKGALGNKKNPLALRESQILKLIADGVSSKDIAGKLGVSIETVKTQRRNMLGKTEAKNTVHLIRLAIANYWI